MSIKSIKISMLAVAIFVTISNVQAIRNNVNIESIVANNNNTEVRPAISQAITNRGY